MTRAIVFVHGWQGRQPGDIDRRLGLGQMEALVQRRWAMWLVDPEGEKHGVAHAQSVSGADAASVHPESTRRSRTRDRAHRAGRQSG